MNTEGRVEFGFQLRARALAFYNYECARCDISIQKLPLELHHLREDPESRGSRSLSNAIPLCPNHHTPIQRSSYLTQPALTEEMSPGSLRGSGFDYLLRGIYEKSYACFCLGAYFFEERQAKLFYAADCAIGCIAALRAIQGRFDADVLLRDAIRNAARLIQRLRDGDTIIWKAQFLRQLELSLFDYGEFDLAAECCKRARSLFNAATHRQSAYPEDIELMKANAARAHLLTADEIDDELLSDFAATKKTLKKYGDWRGYCTNLDVESSVELSLRGPTTRVRDIVEEALYYRRRIFNPWVVGQLLYREGILRIRQDRQKTRAKEVLAESLKIFASHCITPEPRRDGIERGPGEALRRLGVADAQLINSRGRFPLRRKEILRLIRLVEGGRK